MKTCTIKGQTFGFVEVVKDATDYTFHRVNQESIIMKWTSKIHPLNVHDRTQVDVFTGNLMDYKWPTIFGSIYRDGEETVCDFDPELIVESWVEERMRSKPRHYRVYDNSDPEAFYTSDKLDSLVSLLASLDFHLVNPLGESDPYETAFTTYPGLGKESREWQEAESKVTRNKIIVIQTNS